MKKVLSLVLTAFLVLSLMPVALGEGAAIDFDEAPYTIHVCYPVLSEAQTDLAMIQEKLNELTLETINANVELEAVGLFSMANVYALKASSQEPMDLIMLMPGSTYLATFANNGLIRAVDEELDAWGADIKEVVGERLGVGRYNGQQYAIPQNGRLTRNAIGFKLSAALCDQYGIDVDAIETLEDLEAAFAIIKENEPELTILAPEQTGGNIMHVLMGYIDALGYAASKLVENEDGSLEVVANPETEIYMQAAQKVREWYEKGYISRDVNTAQESGSQMLWAGKLFATAAPSLGPEGGNITNGVRVVDVLFDFPPVLATTDNQLQLWAVSTTSQRPDKAVQLINFLDSSAEASNLLRFGIEGVHYTVLEDGSIDVSTNAGWVNNWDSFGDANSVYVRNDALVAGGDISLDAFMGLVAAWNDATLYSPAYGFTFDPGAVRTEIAACDAVTDEFGKAIGNGTVDPETEVAKYVERLYAAGLQTILNEQQRQLDAWVAEQ